MRRLQYCSYTLIVLIYLTSLCPCQSVSSIRDFSFGDTTNEESFGDTSVPVVGLEDEELDDAESGSTAESGIEPTPEKTSDEIVYYRVQFNITSIDWKPELTQRQSKTYEHYSKLLKAAIEKMYDDTEGKQICNIISYEDKREGGVLVSIDLGTVGYSEKETLQEIMGAALSDGSIGTFDVSSQDWQFTELGEGYVICPDEVGRKPSALENQKVALYLIINNLFPCNGDIYAWEYYRLHKYGVGYAGVWRQISGTEYLLISKTLLPVAEAGLRRVKLDKSIAVKKGDFIGVHYPDKQDAIIAATNERSTLVPKNEMYNTYVIPIVDKEIPSDMRVNIDGFDYDIESTTFALRALMEYAKPDGEGPNRGDITVGICKDHEFTCADRKCIKGIYQCDGEKDCLDNSDEVNCPTEKGCLEGQLPCTGGRNECYYEEQKCDGKSDCIDATDETNCPEPSACKDDEFRCSDGKCINNEFRCNSRSDCSDGGDELNCPTQKACKSDEFKCDDGMCIDKSNVCDDNKDCADGSDENEVTCPKLTLPPECGENLFVCTNTKCVSPKKKKVPTATLR